MSIDDAVAFWAGLAQASPRGCRLHLTGGEPFGHWPRLAGVAKAAFEAGLSSPGGPGPLDKVETNAFWATDAAVVRDRLRELDRWGMRKLAISADPYHQQFVPIERCRLAAGIAQEVLGADRVQVRWRDWLKDGFDTGSLGDQQRRELFANYAMSGRERMNGRAAGLVAPLAGGLVAGGGQSRSRLRCKAVGEFADSSCGETLLGGRHVHVDGAGRVIPGVCAGITLGWLQSSAADGGRAGWPGRMSAGALWHCVAHDWSSRRVLARLVESGPCGLLAEAAGHGFVPRAAYVSKCQLCFEIRRHLALSGLHAEELGPRWLYDEVR